MDLSLGQLLEASSGLHLGTQAQQVDATPMVKRGISKKDRAKEAAIAYKGFKDEQRKWIKPMLSNRNKAHLDFRRPRAPELTVSELAQRQPDPAI
jgi:U3 small nucleolar RNA-associated protein 14